MAFETLVSASSRALVALFTLDVCVEAQIVAADGGLLSDFILLFIFTATLSGFTMRYRGAGWVSFAGLVVFGTLALEHAGIGTAEAPLASLPNSTVMFRLGMVVGLGAVVAFLTRPPEDSGVQRSIAPAQGIPDGCQAVSHQPLDVARAQHGTAAMVAADQVIDLIRFTAV